RRRHTRLQGDWSSDVCSSDLSRRAAGAALCLSEREDNEPPPLVETAPFGYVRLRLENYADAALRRWAERLASTSWQSIHVYFMRSEEHRVGKEWRCRWEQLHE